MSKAPEESEVQIVTEADAWQPDPRWRSKARLTILLGEDDHYHHRPRYHEIVRRARDAGLAGASVWRGVEGYGVSSRIHTTRILDLAENLPAMVMIIDDSERLRDFVVANAELFDTGTVTLSAVQMWQSGSGESR